MSKKQPSTAPLPDVLTADVTERDIKDGKLCDAHTCALARAMTRALKSLGYTDKVASVAVFTMTVQDKNDPDAPGIVYYLGPEATRFVRDFDMKDFNGVEPAPGSYSATRRVVGYAEVA